MNSSCWNRIAGRAMLVVAFSGLVLAAFAPSVGAQDAPATAPAVESAADFNKPDLAPLPDGIEVITPIFYKKPHGWKRQMNIYVPKKRPSWPMPVLVGVHGGGWSRGSLYYLQSNADTVKFIQAMTSSGIAVATINYGAGEPGTTVPMMVANCKDAVRWLRLHAKEYRLDPNRIGVTGGSSGGHLATMVAVTNDEQFPGDPGLAKVSSKVSFAISLAGSMDFTIRRGGIVSISPDPSRQPATRPDERPDRPTGGRGGRASIFTGPHENQMDNYRYLSPVTYLTKDSAPLLIIQGSKDPVVPIENAEVMADKAEKVGAVVRYLRVDKGNHTLFYDSPADTLPSPQEVAEIMARFAKWHYGMVRK